MAEIPFCSVETPPVRRLSFLIQLHRDETGVVSLLTVFLMLGCTWMLLWLLNSAKQLDSKVRMQNAVDAAGQSGTGILARGMNAVAFANQLEADLLAAVIVMRAAQSTPAASSPLVGLLLPVFEEILNGPPGLPATDRSIPIFRHDVVRRIPALADEMTRTVGRANGLWRGVNSANIPDGPQGPLLVQLWTTSGQPVGQGTEDDPRTRTLPLIDPNPEGPDAVFVTDPDGLLRLARQERERLIRHYIPIWASDISGGDPVVTSLLITRADISRRILLNGIYSSNNLPMLLRASSPNSQELERDLMFIAVAYRQHAHPTAAKTFHNPNAALAPAMAFAQTHLFLPRQRYVCCPWGEWKVQPETGDEHFISNTDGWPAEWDAFAQNWQAKLVPATARSLSAILGQGPANSTLNRPTWGALTPRQFDELTHH